MFVAVRRAVVAGVVASCVAISGCAGSDDKPGTLPPLSATPTSASPSATSASEHEALAAATAVVRRYFAIKNHLEQRMDADALAAITTSDCTCRRFVAAVRETAARHQRYFGRSVLRSLTPAANDSGDVEVLVEYDTTAGGTKDVRGQVVAQGPGRRAIKAVFTVVQRRDRWLIRDIANVDAGRVR